MKTNKYLFDRLFGKIKQNKIIPYKFHLNVSHGGFGKTKVEVFETLISTISSWAEKNSIIIEFVETRFKHLCYIEFIVRDYRAVSFFEGASKGTYIKFK